LKTKEEELTEYFEENDITDKMIIEVIKNKFLSESIDEKEENIIQQILLNKIESEKLLFWEKYEESFKMVDTLISFVSLSNQSKEAFEKTLTIFNGRIKNLILLYTRQSYSKLENINFEGIKITKTLIEDPDDFNAISYEIRKAIEKEDIDSEKIVIDTTLGFKMVSLAFYKLSTEMNIKSVNWKQVQFINRDKRGKEFIVPGSDFINVIDNPKLENYKLYRDINEALDSMNFEAAAYLYHSINNNSTYLVYKALGRIFSYENLTDYDRFCDFTEEEIKHLREIKLSKSDKIKFNSIFVLLENIVKEKSKNEMILEDFFSIEKIIKYDIRKGIISLTEDFPLDLEICKDNSKYLWLSFALKILDKRKMLGTILFDEIKEEIIRNFEVNKKDKRLIAEMSEERFIVLIANIFKNIIENGENNIEDISQILEESLKEEIEKNIFNRIFNQCFSYREETGKNIYFQNGYFYLKKYGIKIEEKKLLKFKTKDSANWFKNMVDILTERGDYSREELKHNVESNYEERKEDAEKYKAENEHKNYEKMIKIRIDKAISRVWKEMVEYFNEKFEEEINKIGIKKISGKKILISNQNRLRINEIYLK